MAAPGGCEAPTPVVAPAASADEELEKRKARAARFGIALVESSKPKTKSAPVLALKAAKATEVSPTCFPTQPCDDALQLQDPGKLRARTERFGAGKLEQTGATTVAAVSSKKRDAAVLEEVDLDEQERRRKRAERFGTSVVVRSKLDHPWVLMQTWLRVRRLDVLHFGSHRTDMLPLWILCTVMIGGGLFASTVPVAHPCCSLQN
jgi:hypothetical protein